MGISWPTILLSALAQLIVSVIIAGVTVQLALRRFRSEKWWERRWEAYVSIIRDMHHIKRDASTQFDATIESRELSEETKAELSASVRAAQIDLMFHSDVGELLLSVDAMESVKKTARELQIVAGRRGGYEQFLDETYGAANEGLTTFRAIAKRDLAVGNQNPVAERPKAKSQ